MNILATIITVIDVILFPFILLRFSGLEFGVCSSEHFGVGSGVVFCCSGANAVLRFRAEPREFLNETYMPLFANDRGYGK